MSHTICSRCNEKPAAICISCLTDCTEQPPAGEFIKEMREKYQFAINEKLCVSAVDFDKTLVRLDSAEASNADLLTALEKAQWLLGVFVEEGKLNADYSIKKDIEAAISKAKKKG